MRSQKTPNDIRKRIAIATAMITLVTFTAFSYDVLQSDSNFTTQRTIALVGIFLSLISYELLGFSLKKSELRSPKNRLLAYHILLSLLMLLVLTPTNPFSFLWIVLLIMSEYYFSLKVAVASLAGYATINFAVLLLAPSVSNQDIVLIISRVIFLGLLVIVLDTTRRLSKDEMAGLNMSLKWSSKSVQRYESLINNLAEAVLGVDESQLIMVYNHELQDMLDTNEDMHNMRVDRFMELADRNGQPIALKNILPKRTTSLRRNDLYIKRQDEFLPVSMSIAAVKPRYGTEEALKHTIVIRDISAEKSIENEKNEFISVVSHELRTPIAIAEGNLSNAIIINDHGKKDSKIKDALKVTHDQIVYLADMMNDLDTISRADRNTLDIKLESVNPEEIINEIEAKYTSKAIKKGLKMFIESSDTFPIITSKVHLLNIVSNLIDNALQFTEKGHVKIRVTGEDKKIVFEVIDTGIGIAKENQDRIFDKFYRVEDYETRLSGGTGLGLYIALKLAERINGKLSVESELKKGSTFKLVISSMSGN